ncbi:MAG: hypothetical protein RBU23_01135 [Candidatus Auribacterota bacterium]|nr:hypothetical protein [Candidatus Auribacterota bacterium]
MKNSNEPIKMPELLRLRITGAIRYCLIAVAVFSVTAQLFFGCVTPRGFIAMGLCGLFIMFMIRIRKRTFLPAEKFHKYILPVLICIGIVVRVVSIVAIPNRQVSDFQIYHELARALARGHGFAYTGTTGLLEDLPMYLNKKPALEVTTAFRPPGFPLMLSLVYRVLGSNPVYGKWLNLLIGMLAGICVYYLLLPVGLKAAFFASLLWFIYPAHVLATNLLGTELPFVCALTAGALAINHIPYVKSRFGILLACFAGLVLGFGTLIRPEIFIALCAVLALFMIDIPLRRLALIIFVFTICFAVAPSLWGLRNYRQFGVFHIQPTNVGMELMTRSPLEMGEKLGSSWRYRLLVGKLNRSSDEFERSATAKKIAYMHFRKALRHYGVIGFFSNIIIPNWIGAWEDDEAILTWCCKSEYMATQRDGSPVPVSDIIEDILEIFTAFGYLSVTLFALAGIIFFRPARWTPGIVFLSSYAIVSSILLSVFISKPRFHFVSITVFCIFAGYFINVFFLMKPEKKSVASRMKCLFDIPISKHLHKFL